MAKSKKGLKWKFLKQDGVLNRQYKVSNFGDIMNAKTGRVLKQGDMSKKSPFNSTDYKAVNINGKCSRVHRLVCETFHGAAPKGKAFVLHNDERKNNNIASNLKWGSASENAYASYAKYPRGQHSLATIKRVKRLLNKGYTNDKVAQMTKVSDSQVSLIKLGRSRRYVEPFTNVQIELNNV